MTVQVAYCRECDPKQVIASVVIDPKNPTTLNNDWKHVLPDGTVHIDTDLLTIKQEKATEFLAGKETVEQFHTRLATDYGDDFA